MATVNAPGAKYETKLVSTAEGGTSGRSLTSGVRSLRSSSSCSSSWNDFGSGSASCCSSCFSSGGSGGGEELWTVTWTSLLVSPCSISGDNRKPTVEESENSKFPSEIAFVAALRCSKCERNFHHLKPIEKEPFF